MHQQHLAKQNRERVHRCWEPLICISSFLICLVFFLLIAHVISYPSLREIATDDEENKNDLQLALRSIVNHLNNEQIERSIASDKDDSDQYEYTISKRQGGYNIIKPDLKCEIECVGKLRNPSSGQGMSITDATNACKNICANTNKKRQQKITIGQRKQQSYQKNLREFTDDDNNNSNEE